MASRRSSTSNAFLTSQEIVDRRNAAFWDELCGSGLARSHGIVDRSDESLRRFDAAYLALYPYLAAYLPQAARGGAPSRVLEVGLGFGTVGQLLVEQGFSYEGFDIAEGPVEMMHTRLSRLGARAAVSVASALDLPAEDASFDHYVSIGCLHHTGDVPRAIDEAYRVLRPRGRALVMLYNARSLRRLAMAVRDRVTPKRSDEQLRAAYDVNSRGEAAPQTEFFSKADVRRMFNRFEGVNIDVQNFDAVSLARGRIVIPRDRLLGTVAHRMGLDLYITAIKPADTGLPGDGR